jgi:hypothetical protein
MPRITKPCPECGGTEHLRASPTSICNGCKRDIAYGKRRREDDERMAGVEVTVETKEAWYALPRYNGTHGSPSRETHDAAQRTLLALIATVSRVGSIPGEIVHVPAKSEYTESSRLYEWRQSRVMRKDVAEAIVNLDRAIRAMVRSASDEAYEEGQDLLGNLATGRMSLEALNKMTVTGNKR